MLLSYKPLHLEAQQRLQEEGCVLDINYHQLTQVVVVPRHSEYMFTARTILLHFAAVEVIEDFISLNLGICL